MSRLKLMDVDRGSNKRPYESCWKYTEVLMDVLVKADGRPQSYKWTSV